MAAAEMAAKSIDPTATIDVIPIDQALTDRADRLAKEAKEPVDKAKEMRLEDFTQDDIRETTGLFAAGGYQETGMETTYHTVAEYAQRTTPTMGIPIGA